MDHSAIGGACACLGKGLSKGSDHDALSGADGSTGDLGNRSHTLPKTRLDTPPPIYNKVKRSYEFRMSEVAPRDVICVVAAINPIPEPDKLFAVTVWEV